MIEITFTGETLEDVAAQASTFAATVLPAEKKPGKPRKAGKTEPAPDAAEPEPPAETAPDPKEAAKAKDDALDLLRKVYGRGDEGQKAVKAILKDFGVKKAGDVPAERGHELLVAATAANAKLVEDDPL